MRCALENISTADGIRNPSSSLALAIIICANEVTSRADGRRVGATCCELVLLVMVGILRRHGYPPPQVNFLGKAATFNLMYAFPLLLLSDGSGWISSLAAIFGWAFAGWGTTLYWWAGILYVVQVRRLVSADAMAD